MNPLAGEADNHAPSGISTILNGKHVGFSEKRILEEIGRKEQFWGGANISAGRVRSDWAVLGAENKMKPDQ